MKQKILWNLEIQTHHQIQAGRPDLVLSNIKGISYIEDFAILKDNRVKMKVKVKESEKLNKCLDRARELKKM